MTSSVDNRGNYDIGIKIVKKETISPERICLITNDEKVSDLSNNMNPTKSFEISNLIGDMLNFGGKSRNAQRNTLGVAKSSSILNSDKIQQSNSYSNKNQMYTQILKSINIAKTIKMPKTIKNSGTVLKKSSDFKKVDQMHFNEFITKHLKSLKTNTTNKGKMIINKIFPRSQCSIR
jgi:hypothetical protein